MLPLNYNNTNLLNISRVGVDHAELPQTFPVSDRNRGGDESPRV